MTRKEAQKYAKELRRFIGEMTEDTSCVVQEVVGDMPAIEITPGETNESKTFYYGTEIVDFCRGHKLDFWIGAEIVDGQPSVNVHIF